MLVTRRSLLQIICVVWMMSRKTALWACCWWCPFMPPWYGYYPYPSAASYWGSFHAPTYYPPIIPAAMTPGSACLTCPAGFESMPIRSQCPLPDRDDREPLKPTPEVHGGSSRDNPPPRQTYETEPADAPRFELPRTEPRRVTPSRTPLEPDLPSDSFRPRPPADVNSPGGNKSNNARMPSQAVTPMSGEEDPFKNSDPDAFEAKKPPLSSGVTTPAGDETIIRPRQSPLTPDSLPMPSSPEAHRRYDIQRYSSRTTFSPIDTRTDRAIQMIVARTRGEPDPCVMTARGAASAWTSSPCVIPLRMQAPSSTLNYVSRHAPSAHAVGAPAHTVTLSLRHSHDH